MLVLTRIFENYIKDSGEDPQIYPLTDAVGWGSLSTFDSDFANLTFNDVFLYIKTMEKNLLNVTSTTKSELKVKTLNKTSTTVDQKLRTINLK